MRVVSRVRPEAAGAHVELVEEVAKVMAEREDRLTPDGGNREENGLRCDCGYPCAAVL